MMWKFGVLAALQLVPLICGVRDSQQTIHDHLQLEDFIPVQSHPVLSHVIFEGSGDIGDSSEENYPYKVTKPFPSSTEKPRDKQSSVPGQHDASVIILYKPSPAIIVLIVILILLLVCALLVIGYLWRRVRILKEKNRKPHPTKGEFDEDEYSVMMDWSVN